MNENMMAVEALSRARGGISVANYHAILEGFAARGIPMDLIVPRENVFTFNAWRALGRTVRKGEHGVKILTWIPMQVKDGDTKKRAVRPRSATVFHVSQTEALQG